MLDLDKNRAAVAPKDAATLVIVRDGESGVELFCVERSKGSSFMGGAIVFPGGKLDPGDADPEWRELTTAAASPTFGGRGTFANDEDHMHALAVASCRESLEEAAIVPLAGGTAPYDDILALREDLKTNPAALRAFLRARGLRLDLGALLPLARWITPEAESRRFDARFFAIVAPAGQEGAHDQHETMSSFWATPREVLRRFDAGEVQLMPPTHCTISLLAGCERARDVLALASLACLDPICPRLVEHVDASGTTFALALPGDPAHDVRDPRVRGRSRYVLRGERWLPEDAPG